MRSPFEQDESHEVDNCAHGHVHEGVARNPHRQGGVVLVVIEPEELSEIEHGAHAAGWTHPEGRLEVFAFGGNRETGITRERLPSRASHASFHAQVQLHLPHKLQRRL